MTEKEIVLEAIVDGSATIEEIAEAIIDARIADKVKALREQHSESARTEAARIVRELEQSGLVERRRFLEHKVYIFPKNLY